MFYRNVSVIVQTRTRKQESGNTSSPNLEIHILFTVRDYIIYGLLYATLSLLSHNGLRYSSLMHNARCMNVYARLSKCLKISMSMTTFPRRESHVFVLRDAIVLRGTMMGCYDLPWWDIFFDDRLLWILSYTGSTSLLPFRKIWLLFESSWLLFETKLLYYNVYHCAFC